MIRVYMCDDRLIPDMCMSFVCLCCGQDGRLRSGDHILQIGHVNVRGMGSEQVASVLRQSGAHVRLIVARGMQEPIPGNPGIIPTHALDDHLHHLNNRLMDLENMPGQEHMDNYGVIVGPNNTPIGEFTAQMAQVRPISTAFQNMGVSEDCRVSCITLPEVKLVSQGYRN